tara:strand:+ start:357 stop:1283 length:927 start_codon:yes stop_codon:yes gene_type:complete
MQKILIIGGAGYLGSYMTNKLIENKHNVTVVDIFKNSEKVFNHIISSKHLNVYKKDARELTKNDYKNYDIVIPLAALVGAPICKLNPLEAKSLNFELTKKIIKNLSKNQKILYPTTNSGYGATTGKLKCNEKTPLNPISLYGIYKKQSEEIIMDRENSVSFRLATVFGVSPRHRTDLLVNDFVYKAYHEKCLVLFEQHFKRNYIHLNDVSEGFKFAIKNFQKMKGEVYNLGLSRANLSKRELALKIKKYVKNLTIISSKIGTDPDKRNYIVDNSKIEKIGFKAKTSIDSGIEELIKYYSYQSKLEANV